MALITHKISTANDGLGDELRTAFSNQNLMNSELYTETGQLREDLTAAVTGASGKSIVPTDIPDGTGIKSWIATQAGTYTNFGGVVVNTNSFAVISRDAAGAFSISQTALDLTQYAKTTDLTTYSKTVDVNKTATQKSVNTILQEQSKKYLNGVVGFNAGTATNQQFTGGGGVLAFQNTDGTEPLTVAKYLRLSGVGSETTSNLFVNKHIGFWVRESDLGTQIKFTFYNYNTAGTMLGFAQSTVLLADMYVGNEITMTGAYSTIGKISFKSSTNGWLFVQFEGVADQALTTRYSVKFQINGGQSKIDFLNLISLQTKFINPYFNYFEVQADLTLFLKTNAQLQAEIDTNKTNINTKATYLPPLKTFTKSNAVDYIRGSETVDKHLISTGGALKNVFNQTIYDSYQIPNTIRATSLTALGADFPQTALFISPTDLINVGIVPNNTTPPIVNIKTGWLKSTLVNVTNPTIYFSLRYGGTVSPEYDSTNDVMTFNNQTSFYWSAAGDETYWNSFGHTMEVSDTTAHKIYAHKNIPIPATYKGKNLTGIFLIYKPGSTGACQYDIFSPSITLNSVAWDITSPYLTELEKSIAKTSSASSLSTKTITVKNSSRILIIGDSFTSGGARDFKDKGWVSKFSSLSNYVCEGFGTSGDTYLDGANAIITNAKRYHPTVGVQDITNTYAILMFAENDTAYWLTLSAEYWRKNIERLCDTVESIGAKPILCTEFGNASNLLHYTILKDVANERGYQFIDISSDGYTFNANRYLPFWNVGHPGVRTGALIWYGMHKALKGLNDIEQGIKIFRNRTTFTYSAVNDLLYRNVYDREEKWREISIGHRRSTDATVNYYDDLDLGTIASQVENSEYLKLVNNESVTFADKALLRITIPATAKNVTSAKLILSNKALTCYVRKYIDASLVTELYPSANYYTSIAKPNGIWEAKTANADGDFEFTDLTKYMDYDTMEILLSGTGSFSLSDVKLEWNGTANKVKTVKELAKIEATTELLTKTLLDDASISGWTNPNAKTPIVPFDSNVPLGTTKIIELNEGETLSQSFSPNTTTPQKAIIEVWARRLPAKFTYSNTFSLHDATGANPIFEDSYDNGKLTFSIKKDTYIYPFEEIIPLHWVKLKREVYLTSPKSDTYIIELKATSKAIQIAYVSVKK